MKSALCNMRVSCVVCVHYDKMPIKCECAMINSQIFFSATPRLSVKESRAHFNIATSRPDQAHETTLLSTTANANVSFSANDDANTSK